MNTKGFLFDREALFQMLASKDWDQIAKIMYRNVGLLRSDPIVKNAIELFETEFLSETEGLSLQEKLKAYEYPSLVIESRPGAFSPTFVERLVNEKIRVLRSLKSDRLLSYAASHPESRLAQEVLQEIQEKNPEVIADVRRPGVSVTATDIDVGEPKVRNLFRSKQEQNFFEAVRSTFPTYHPYPNVALSCVLDFDSIRLNLKEKEKEYFFRAIVDAVVFDTKDGYIPRFFIELDSRHHDSDKAQQNDGMKDAIFRAANVKLIRIRAYEEAGCTVESFRQLVLEVMRGL